MNDIDKAIINGSNVICKNIDKFDSTERGILSQNILSKLRTFVENISLKIFSKGNDLSSDTVVPFQVAYAIYKAQGLEYKTVKIIISEESEENISHNIFYTAITRTKRNLTIYWSPETENKVLSGLEHKVNKKDIGLLSNKYSLK